MAPRPTGKCSVTGSAPPAMPAASRDGILLLAPIAYRPEKRRGPHEELAIRDRHGTQTVGRAVFREFVGGEDLELRSGSVDRRDAFLFRRHIDLAVGEYRGRAVVARRQPLRPVDALFDGPRQLGQSAPRSAAPVATVNTKVES